MVDGEERMRRVTAIRNGTVIDHIPSGHAVTVLEILGISGRRVNPVSMVMNVPSGKMEHKDIIKIDDRELDQHELDRLALVAPDASVSIIREYRVAEKLQIRLGEEIVNVARCSYRNCATNGPREPMPHRLVVMGRNPLRLRCHYCLRPQGLEDIIDHLV